PVGLLPVRCSRQLVCQAANLTVPIHRPRDFRPSSVNHNSIRVLSVNSVADSLPTDSGREALQNTGQLAQEQERRRDAPIVAVTSRRPWGGGRVGGAGTAA